jgi:heptosyltransferase III
MGNCKEKVLIFRVGSLGDTVVALPAFNLVRREFCNAEIKVLTNFPVGYGDKEALLQSVFGKSTLVDGYYNYSTGRGNLRGLLSLVRDIRKWGVTHLVYMMPVRTKFMIFRDWIFFKYIIGISVMFGISFSKKNQIHLYDELTGLYEFEAQRILRNLSKLGTINLDQSSFDLGILPDEVLLLPKIINPKFRKIKYIACCVGTKWNSKDWGKERWSRLMERISIKYPDLGLIMIGSGDEFSVSNEVKSSWDGLSQNLCGKLTIRESAEILRNACCYLGHDSGPMHLAYSVQTPCISVFSAQGKPGVWFPIGSQHKILYHKTECFGCELEFCKIHNKKCIKSISIDEVFDAANGVLKEKCVE